MLNAKSIRKVLCVLLLAVFALSLVATSPVLAYLYRATFTVSNNGSTDYTALPVTCSPVDVDFLIANGFITTATALDTRVETLGGTDQIHMMAEDRIMAFCPSLESDSQLNWYLSTGNTALADFPVIVGDDGYITVTDHADLELGNNFSIEFEGWVDASVSNTYVNQTDSFQLTDDGVGSVVATLNYTQYYYNEGVLEDDWTIGYVSGAGSQSKMADHLYLVTGVVNGDERTYVTDAVVNLTDVNTLYIDWESLTMGRNYLVVSTNKMADYNTFNYRLSHTDAIFGRTVESLDVSAASGNYYIRVHTRYSLATAQKGELSVYRVYTDSGLLFEISATGVSADEHIVTAWGNTTHFGLDVDGVTEDSVVLGEVNIPDCATDWAISSIPYFNYYKHSVNGTLIAWYQPISYIVGTTLPNRLLPGSHDGTITWGTNPTGVNVTLGSLTAPESTVTTEEEEGGYQGAMHNVGVTDWFLEPDVGTKLAAHPLRPLVTIWSDNSTVTEVQAWRFLGLALLLLITVVAAVIVRGHLLIAGLACGGTIALLVQQTVWPGWTLVFIIPAIIAGVMAERTPSIG